MEQAWQRQAQRAKSPHAQPFPPADAAPRRLVFQREHAQSLGHLSGSYCSKPPFFCDDNAVGSLLPFVNGTGDLPLLGIARIGVAGQDLDRAFNFTLPVREVIAAKTTEVQPIGAKNDRKPDNRTCANSVAGFTNNGNLAL